MNNIRRIVAFGDSNTFGQGLKDNVVTSAGFDYNVPSKFAYPALLGKQFNVPVENLSIPGCGNETIFRLLCNYIIGMPSADNILEANSRMQVTYQEGDLVLVGLSEPSRKEVYDCRNKAYHRIIAQQTPRFYDPTLDKSAKFLMSLESEESLFVKTLHQIGAIKSMLTALGATYLIYHVLPAVGTEYYPITINNYTTISIVKKYEAVWRMLQDKNYIPHMIHSIASGNCLPCKHPNEAGQELIADFLSKIINEL